MGEPKDSLDKSEHIAEPHDSDQVPLRRTLGEVQRTWGKALMEHYGVSGVIGYGAHTDYRDAMTVFVAPGTDITDEEVFPRTVEGEPVVYLEIPRPETYSVEAVY